MADILHIARSGSPVLQPSASTVYPWAQTEPLTCRAWLLGSRVAGTHDPESDIDVAVEHDALPWNADPFDTWLDHVGRWRKQLAQQLNFRPDLWRFEAGRTPMIEAALSDGCIRVLHEVTLGHQGKRCSGLVLPIDKSTYGCPIFCTSWAVNMG